MHRIKQPWLSMSSHRNEHRGISEPRSLTGVVSIDYYDPSRAFPTVLLCWDPQAILDAEEYCQLNRAEL